MRKYALAAASVALCLFLAGCAGTVYTRNWVVNSANLTDTLTISGEAFTLERTGQTGTSVFEGKFEESGEQWIFDVTSWKPSNAAMQRFNPPVRYLYRVKVFQNGVSFLSLVDVVGTSTFQFIQKGDFEIQ